MFDPGSPKLIVPTLLFAGLDRLKLSPAERSAWFVVGYWLIVKSGLLKVSLTKADLVVPAGLVAGLPMLQVPPPARIVAFVIVFSFLRTAFPGYY